MVVRRLGRHFGFQAFNLDSRSDRTKNVYTPATIFLVTDHLHHLLVRNYMRRDKTSAADEEKFIRAVYRLHAGIFQAYKDWCKHVGLMERLQELEYASMLRERGNVLEWEYLLEELSLYFLVYTEASNVRHCPELLWFLFWVMRNSKNRAAAVMGLPCTHPNSANQAIYSEEYRAVVRKQIHLRNKYDAEITMMRRDLHVSPNGDYKDDRELESIKAEAVRSIRNLLPNMRLETDLMVDMVAYGDSGSFLDRVIEPIFNYFALEVLEKKMQGKDIQARVAYDDCNESLCSKEMVKRVLSDLGIKINMRRKRIFMNNDPYDTLLSVGEEGQALRSQATNQECIAEQDGIIRMLWRGGKRKSLARPLWRGDHGSPWEGHSSEFGCSSFWNFKPCVSFYGPGTMKNIVGTGCRHWSEHTHSEICVMKLLVLGHREVQRCPFAW
eukprot:jgi/Picre1/28978/NNA_004372.t1